MRHTSRLGASLRYVVLPVVVLIFSFVLGRTVRGQASGASLLQSEQSVTSPALPAAWNDGVKALAEKIAAAVKPSRAISLEVNNISSLGSSEVEAIRAALETELTGRGLQLGSAGAGVEVTLSENVESYIWVAEVRRNSGEDKTERVGIFSVPRAVLEIGNEPKVRLVLSQKLIWEQSEKILDFAIVDTSSSNFSRLLVLSAGSLRFYRAANTRWELERDIPIPHSAPWPRDVSGWIDAGKSRAYIPGEVCDGNFSQPESVRCGSSGPTRNTRPELRIKIEGHEGVDTATVGPVCGESLGALAAGTADWTQPDSIQGYLSQDGRVVESGTPIETDGPVLSIYPNEAPGSARAVVWNLRTRNYEAHIVTATCSQ